MEFEPPLRGFFLMGLRKNLLSLAFCGLAISLISPFLALAGTAEECPANFFQGQPPAISRAQLLQRSVELCFREFALLHSGLTKTPLWSAEHITKQRVIDAKSILRVDVFHEESRIAAADRADLKDYKGSGYDRGHMSPAADMATTIGQDESFSLANMVPQNAKLNRNLWAHMESTVRALTDAYGDVYVVTGPAFIGEKLNRLNGRVIVPSHVFKAVYVPQVGAGAAWWADNSGNGTAYETISLTELKIRTGIDPFPGLDYMVKDHLITLPKPTAQADSAIAGKTHRPMDQMPTGSVADADAPAPGWWDYANAAILKLLK